MFEPRPFACLKRNFYPTNIFIRWIFLPDKYYQIIEVSGGEWRTFLIFPHEFSIQPPNFKVIIRENKKVAAGRKEYFDCNWWWLDQVY